MGAKVPSTSGKNKAGKLEILSAVVDVDLSEVASDSVQLVDNKEDSDSEMTGQVPEGG